MTAWSSDVLIPHAHGGAKGAKWKKLAEKFIEQNPNPIYGRAATYLRALADGKCAEGKAPEALPWHVNGQGRNFQGMLMGDMQTELLPAAQFRARWA